MSLSAALFSPAQAKLLEWLYGQPERAFHIKELLRLTGLGSASLQRELKRLSEGGLLVSEPVGNLRRVHANPNSPVFAEMVALVRKTLGVVPLVRDALGPFEGRIELAFIYGSVAKETDHAGSDIDLLVVSDAVSVAELLPSLLLAEAKLGRKVNPTVYQTRDFEKKRSDNASFVGKVLSQPTLDLLGKAHALAPA